MSLPASPTSSESRRCSLGKSRALMVGDSLSSDMEGARNAGVDACWYNPKGKTAPPDLLAPTGPIRYEIRELMELAEILAAA